MSHLLLKERHSDLTVEVTPVSDTPDITYAVSIFADRGDGRVLLWKAGYDEQDYNVHRGVEDSMSDLITSAKAGILPDCQERWEDFEWVRDVVVRTCSTTAFASRFNNAANVTRSVFHSGERICYPAKLDIIGRPVDLEIYPRIAHDPLSALPTYYLIFSTPGDGEEIRRDGMTLTSGKRTCCFNYTGSELRFDEDDIVATFKEELIVALGLEGKPE